MIDPNDYVISRRRKKYKFAKFANAENCFELSEWKTRDIDVVEIGAGTGLFSVELAARSPEQTFLALDVKADRLQKGAYAALEKGIKNVFFLRARADQLPEIVAPSSASTVWVTFPDPYPRSRNASRRLMHPNFLALYAQALSGSGSVCLKHDNPEFFRWSLEQLVEKTWHIQQLWFDVHESGLAADDDARLLTTYEQRWLTDGRSSQYVRASAPRG